MKTHMYYYVIANPMTDNEQPMYDDRDIRIIASHIFNELCLRDAKDRDAGRPPASHDLIELAKRVGAFDNSEDVRHLAEDHLAEELHYIERNPHNFQVKLTKTGRDNCHKGIDIPPSDRQIRPQLEI
jgi:HEPN domain-containing protein